MAGTFAPQRQRVHVVSAGRPRSGGRLRTAASTFRPVPTALPFPRVLPARRAAPQLHGARPTTPVPLLLVGHGTRCLPGERQFEAFVRRVQTRMLRGGVDAAGGLIELAPPPVTEAAADLVARGHHEFVAVPLMLFAAGHAKGDIPPPWPGDAALPGPALPLRGRPGPGPAGAGRPGGAPRRGRAAAEQAGAFVVLGGRGSTDPDANSEVARAARLLLEDASRRGVALGGVETAFVSLAEPGVPAALERCRLLGASRIVVLPLFMFTGVLPRRIVGQATAWAAEHPDVEVTCAEVLGDCDQLAEVVEQRYREALAGPVLAGCDTCMYRVALPGFEDGSGSRRPRTTTRTTPTGTHGHGPTRRSGGGTRRSTT
jgi:sirohydrochlorin cobaltochelatase